MISPFRYQTQNQIKMIKLKKIIFGLLVMMFAVVALSSCNKDNDDKTLASTPEAEQVSGTDLSGLSASYSVQASADYSVWASYREKYVHKRGDFVPVTGFVAAWNAVASVHNKTKLSYDTPNDILPNLASNYSTSAKFYGFSLSDYPYDAGQYAKDKIKDFLLYDHRPVVVLAKRGRSTTTLIIWEYNERLDRFTFTDSSKNSRGAGASRNFEYADASTVLNWMLSGSSNRTYNILGFKNPDYY